MSLGLLAEFEKRVSTKKLSFGKTLQGHHIYRNIGGLPFHMIRELC